MRSGSFDGKAKHSGFTLLEVIVSLVVLAIGAAIVITFMTRHVAQSGDPVLLARSGAYLNGIMETITADYKYLMATEPNPLNTLSGKINGTNYSTNPYDVMEKYRISFSGDPPTEQKDDNGKTLKVTIGYGGLTLTALFSE